MLELASAAWKLNIESTVLKLRELGADLPLTATTNDAVEAYRHKVLDPRNKARQLWASAQRQCVESGSVAVRDWQRWMGLAALPADWANHGGEFMGICHCREVRAAWKAGCEGDFGRVFPGTGWGYLLTIPFYDLPGRICGMLCVGRDKDPEKDHIFIPAPEFAVSHLTYRESGVSMFSAAFAPVSKLLAGKLFIFDDPVLALRFQLRWLREHSHPLPIVASYKSSEFQSKRPWQCVRRSQIVSWSASDPISAIEQAKLSGGVISRRRAAEVELQSNITNNYAPDAWLLSVSKNTTTWDVALRKRLRRMGDLDVEEAMLQMRMPPGDTREFLRGCDKDLQERLTRIFENRVSIRRVPHGKNQHVYESEDSWFMSPSNELLADFVVRIEQTLQAPGGRNYYRGVIKHKGTSTPFTERVETVEKNIWEWGRNYLMTQQVGIPTYRTATAKIALNLTLQFHQPVFVKGIDAIGWDEGRRQFNFPSFAIDETGEVLEDQACLFNDSNLPGRRLRPPERVSKKMVETLDQKNEELAVFWGMAACVAANIASTAMRHDPQGVLLDGHGAQNIGYMAAARLGCPETEGLPAELSHQWPALVNCDTKRDFKRKPLWLSSETATRAIVPVEPATARTLGIKQCWNIIRCNRRLGSMQLVDDATAGKVLPAYLKDLCERRLWINATSDNMVENILLDMADWFDRCGGQKRSVLQARSVLELPGVTEPAQQFVDLAFTVHLAGRLGVVRPDHVVDGAPVTGIVYLEDAGVWIPQHALSVEAERLASIPPDVLLITRYLKQADVLLDECDYRDQRGWLVAEDWFSAAFKKCEAAHKESP